MVEKRWEAEFIRDNPEPEDYSGLLTEEQMLAKLRAEIELAGSQAAWCEAHGVLKARLCDLLKGRKSLREQIAAAMGYRMVVMFAPIEDDE